MSWELCRGTMHDKNMYVQFVLLKGRLTSSMQDQMISSTENNKRIRVEFMPIKN